MAYPVVNIAECNLCGGCLEICPEVFILNENAGYVEVAELEVYPEDAVSEAMKNCPQDCIGWEE